MTRAARRPDDARKPTVELAAAIAHGTRRQALEARRDRIASEMETCSARDLAPLDRRLAEIVAALDALGATDDEPAPTPDEPFDPRLI